jgi:hypothetical protein
MAIPMLSNLKERNAVIPTRKVRTPVKFSSNFICENSPSNEKEQTLLACETNQNLAVDTEQLQTY